MNRIKILFLTFVLSLTSVGGLACWDDWDDDWDDWGCYDDWDDDDEVDDEHDDWYYNEETGDYWLYDVEVTGSNDGILMDEVVVTYDTGSDDDNDTNNEDTWSDNGDGWVNDDYGWEDGEDDYNDDDYSVRGTTSDGDSNNNKGEKDEKGIYRIQCKDGTIIIDVFKCEAYKLRDDDKIIVDKLNIPVAYKQINQESTCFIAGLSLAEMMLSGTNPTYDYEGLILDKLGKTYGFDYSIGIYKEGCEYDDMLKVLSLMYGLDSDESKCAFFYNSFCNNSHAFPIGGITSSFLDSCIENKYLIMCDIYVEDKSYYHNVDVFGKTEDGYYLCYDTITGKILALEYSDFVLSYIAIISKSNPAAFK